MNEDRSITLLKATLEILQKAKASPFVLDVLTTTAHYDDTECDGYCLLEDIETHLEDIAALASQPGGWQVPEGFVLVPKEPSQDMKAVGGAMLEREVVLEWKNDDNSSWDDAATVYRAMIAAAPPVQTEKAE